MNPPSIMKFNVRFTYQYPKST